MHPFLFTLFSGLRQINGIGEKRLADFARLGIHNLRDLLYHFPYSVIDRSFSAAIGELRDGINATLELTVVEHFSSPPNRYSKRPYKIQCENETGSINLVYFHSHTQYLKSTMPINAKIIVSGKVSFNQGSIDMVHPDVVLPIEKKDQMKLCEPVYNATNGLSSKMILSAFNNAQIFVPKLPEWICLENMQEWGWASWNESILKYHNPQSEGDFSYHNSALKRLAYDELLAQQISLRILRAGIDIVPKQPLMFTGELSAKFRASLPFELTNDQKKVILEIATDQKSDKKAFRLVQGDVGCGKTFVAMCAIANAIEAGGQAAFMAPTEILALQHYASFKKHLAPLGVKVGCLISALPAGEKRQTLQQLFNGELDVVIGTHALFQDKVQYHNLRLVVVDEQHRFGVEQRLSLVNKSAAHCDFVMMSATPIPRTLTMIGFGDMDVSIIREKPKSRQPIETTVLNYKKLNDLIKSLQKIIDRNEKIFWVCPLVSDSENLDLISANQRYEYLSQYYPGKVGLVHGQMSSQERDLIMQDYLNGKYSILVATTVIEVGVDVSDATVMVIENAERFGLSQLHQLRGRVGRADKKSYCILLAKSGLSDTSYERLNIMRESNDGFEISEKDFEIRGGGDVLGNKQSGMPSFKVFNPFHHQDLIPYARAEAFRAVSRDGLVAPQYHILLNLFDKVVTNPMKMA